METEIQATDRVLGGRYRLAGLLGRGGMADVYEGTDERLGRPVAIKVLRRELLRHPDVRPRFEHEARAAAGLSHPNVVAVYDTGESDDGTPYVVMERLPGETVADRIAAGSQDPTWVVRMAGDVLGALAAAHAAGIVHRDVKPGNILVGTDDCAKVADFGIAKTAEAATGGDTTSTGTLLGTPAYLAPERIDGQQATAQSDLYSLGVVLYEALAGRKPFDGDTPIAMANAVRHTEPAPLAQVRPGLDPALVAAVEQAMAKNPSARFPDAQSMARALGVTGDATTTVPVDTTTVIEAVPSRAMPARQARPVVPIGLLLVAAAALLLIFLVASLAQRADNDGGTGGGGGDPARTELANRMRDVAERAKVGDGPKGPELSERLAQVADEVDAGGGADSGSALLADVTAWHQQRLLFDRISAETTALLQEIPGIRLPAPTVAPAVQPPPVDKDDDKGKGKKGKGDGDDED